MTAVEDLHREVARTGYTESEVVALKMMAEDGFNPELAAATLLNARRDDDPIVLAGKLIRLRRAVR